MDRSESRLLDAGPLEEIRLKGRTVVSGGPVPIVVFYSEGNLHAVDNRCPHMGFPLHRGTVEDGILTCHWHHARFDLESGCTFDLFADDATVYPVEVKDGRVYIDLSAPPRDPVERGLRRLEEGMDQNIRLVMAKAVVSLLRAGADPDDVVRASGLYGVRRRRSGWADGMTILSAMANVTDHLQGDERIRPPVPGGPPRSDEHQRPAAAGPAPAPREQGDPARRAETVVPLPDRGAQRRRGRTHPAGRHRGPFEPGRLGGDGGREWKGSGEFTDALLQDDPHAIVEGLNEALRRGARPVLLAEAITMAAALRIVRFHVNNEFSDWIAVLHTFSYANALHQMLKRAESPEMLRGVYHGAMRVYLDRFLNVPPARLPDAGARAADPGQAMEEYLQLLNQQQQVDEAGRLVSGYLVSGGEPGLLFRALTESLVREDAEFHSFQMLEASIRQHGERTDVGEQRLLMVAAARYLAAKAPTQRELLQTLQIAQRLHRGEAVYEEGTSGTGNDPEGTPHGPGSH